uniref:EGF-like domain-containing protein n=1 Tax=Chromera velia CCMP2878 TaxID=1169474 RepID=A0A0G4FRE2_9ALVE|eukprot:Cvel_3661.t1-p1 / transcript=Cvel_3661.t1 / gene=Cvel_3661 / organism=Chromera_velia_CCMP2878 / gene_product=Fibrillin-1, putative / transcript_product=Fibrillin-1, putative / location=Cvel_scaffold151:94351-114159(-) / protein_length=2134 / sequence_SO=supercontig / SO=protein_coding / is_pseudo=false
MSSWLPHNALTWLTSVVPKLFGPKKEEDAALLSSWAGTFRSDFECDEALALDEALQPPLPLPLGGALEELLGEGNVPHESEEAVPASVGRGKERNDPTTETAAGADRRRLWDATTVLSSSYLTGSNGSYLAGTGASGLLGRGASIAGDVNNDGIDDMILSEDGSSKAYVIFGRDWTSSSFTAEVDLSALDGTNGFTIIGTSSTRAGLMCSGGGDWNNDGIADVLLGAIAADPNGYTNSGELYMIFGRATWPASVTVSALSGSDGVIFTGVGNNAELGRGNANAGDMNGDGIDDFIFGAHLSSQGGTSSGAVFIMYGKATWTSPIEITGSYMDGVVGFRVNGQAGDNVGYEVAGNVDVNNDGIKDVVFGGGWADPVSSKEGQVHVIFGKSSSSFSGTYSVTDIDGSLGITVNGVTTDGLLGLTVGALGDVNGDGIDDFIAGAFEANPEGISNQGEAVVVFGSSDFSALDATDGSTDGKWSVSAFDGSNGFRFYGTASGDTAGMDVHGPGDVNGDGVSDILIGASTADPNSITNAGEAYVIFGQADECTVGRHNCASKATCTDTTNSFTCACNEGYSGTGVSCYIETTSSICTGGSACLDTWTCDSYGDCMTVISEADGLYVDECALGTHICPSIAPCKNTQGAYECLLPETVETTTLQEDSTGTSSDEGAAATVLLLNSLSSFVESSTSGSDGSSSASTSTSDTLANTESVAQKISSTLAGIESSGRTLTEEETQAFTAVLSTASKGLDSVLSSTDSSSLSQDQKDSQTAAVTGSVSTLASSLSAVVSQSSSITKSRSGKSLVSSQLPVLSSLEKTLQSASKDAGVVPGGDTTGSNGTALASRREKLHSATDSVIKAATSSIAPLVLSQASSSGSAVMTTDSFSIAATALPTPSTVAASRSISAEVGPLSVSVKSISDAAAERLRALEGTCGVSDNAFLGLSVVTWGSDVRNYVGGNAKFGTSQSIRLLWCGEDVGARVFGSDQLSVTVGGLQQAGESTGGRRRLSSVEEDGGCSSFDGDKAEWSSLCQPVGGGGCECEGAGAGLMETEYGEVIGGVVGILAGADLSIIWQFDRAREGGTIDNALLWVVCALIGGFIIHMLIAVWRDRRAPRTSTAVVEAACLNTKAVLAAAWENRHQPSMCSFQFLSEQIEKITTEGETGLNDRYQNLFSSDCAYPLTIPSHPGEDSNSPSDAAVSGELGDSLDLQALSFRQTDLVALLTGDAQKVLAQGIGSTCHLKLGREAVVITPEVALIEDRSLSHETNNFSFAYAPLWDPRQPPILPCSLRYSLTARWRRDLLIEPFGDSDWAVLSAARFLIRSGHFRRRLESFAEKQANRYRMLDSIVKAWLVRKGLRRAERENPSADRRVQIDSPNPNRLTATVNLRGFLLPWPPVSPAIGSDEWQSHWKGEDEEGENSAEGEPSEHSDREQETGSAPMPRDVPVLLTVGASFLEIRPASPQDDLALALPAPIIERYGLSLTIISSNPAGRDGEKNLEKGKGKRRKALEVLIPKRFVLDSGGRIICAFHLSPTPRDRAFFVKEEKRTPVPVRYWRERHKGTLGSNTRGGRWAIADDQKESVQEKEQGSGNRVASPSDGAVEFLDESPDYSVLRLFVRCPNAPSGIVGLDISSPRGPGNGQETPRQMSFNDAAARSIDEEEESASVGDERGREGKRGRGTEKEEKNSMKRQENQDIQTINNCSRGARVSEPVFTASAAAASEGQMREGGARSERGAEKSGKDTHEYRDSSSVHVEESTETTRQMLSQIADMSLQWKRHRSTALRSAPSWATLEKQIEEDMRRVRPFGWSTGYLALRLFLRPLRSSLLANSPSAPQYALLPRWSALLIVWTSAFTWFFLLALFFGVLSQDTPEVSSDMGFLELLSAVVSTFTGQTVMGALVIYCLTLPVGTLTDFLMRPRTPKVPLLKNLSEKVRRGGRVTLEDANYFWTANVSSGRRVDRGNCGCLRRKESGRQSERDEKEEEGRNSKFTVSALQSLLPRSQRGRERVCILVEWRRGKVGDLGEEREREDSPPEGAIYRASKKWVLPETYRAWWLWRNQQRAIGGMCFCLLWILFCLFYLLCFALNYPVRPADLAQVGTTVLGLLIIHGVVWPLLVSAGLGASLVLLLSLLQHPGTDL